MEVNAAMNCDHEHISALMDGELDRAQGDATLACVGEGAARECWHLYHIIGDVLRAPDLAACAGDAAFVARLREQLPLQATSPARAPEAAVGSVPDARQAAANDGLFRWKMVAGLASVAAVAVIGWAGLGRLGPQAPEAGAQLALATAAPAAATPDTPLAPQRVVAESAGPATTSTPVMLRDPELDQLLAAHRQAAGSSAFGSGSGFMRNATFEGPAR